MEKRLTGKKVAILVANGFEQVEMTEPKKALEDAGAVTEIVSPERQTVQGWNHDEKAETFSVDMPLDRARSDDYDALLLPGGVRNPDQLRRLMRAVEFIDGFFATGKPVAAICHAPWTLIEAGVVKGKKITSWPSLKTDLTNAGADWVDRPVVVDHGLVTSRKPDDIPVFNQKMIEEFAEGRQQRSRKPAHARKVATSLSVPHS
ncbi:MAG TPA: type 1 glutamine amidotransferase domain-containing protein [Pyrinomonadaceae bacterium]|nr:type 1 glutamine amidotransferase domain-containing protein [Pyrinomonadaceae bacterium]